eukprot:scaffold80931_cov73-Cyclotella_meneghiniana.AAC.6
MAKANSDCKKIVSYLKIVSNHVSVSKDRIGVSQIKRAIQDMDISSQMYRHLVSRRYMRMASHSYD